MNLINKSALRHLMSVKTIAAILLILLLRSTSYAAQSQPRSTSILNTPTAFNIEENSYKTILTANNDGNVVAESFAGVYDSFSIGCVFEFKSLIGPMKPAVRMPGINVKLRFVEGFIYFPSIAVGYAPFYQGFAKNADRTDSGHYPAKLIKRYLSDEQYKMLHYGPFLVFTSPVYLFDSEQFINYGFRAAVQPGFRAENTTYFFGIDIPISGFIKIKTEINGVYWNFMRPGEWTINSGLRLTYVEQLALEFAVSYEPGERIGRSIRIEYHGEF